MKTNICYWCGSESSSADHVPPKSFFPKDKRNELIKIPSCKKHNEELSKLDEKFRFFFQATADSAIALQEFRNKTYRGLTRKESTGFRIGLAKSSAPAILSGEKTMAFEVQPNEMDLFSEKIVRGLYFHHYDEVFHGEVRSVCTHIHSPGFDIKPTISLFSEFRPYFDKGSTKNEEIFEYECGRVIEGGLTAFGMICTFYENVTIFGLGTPIEIPEAEQVAGGDATR